MENTELDIVVFEDDDGNVILEGADNLDFVSPENYNTEYNAE